MKICLVSPYDLAYPGGVTNHVTELAKQFSERGHEVKILGPASDSVAFQNNPLYIPMGRPVPVPSGGSVARISFSIWLEPRIKAVLGKEAFDIIHLHEPLSSFLPLCVLSLSKTTNIGTFHAYHGSARMYALSHRILRRWFRKLHGRIAVSKPAMEFVGRYFPADYKVIPNGIDLEHFSADAPPFPQWMDDKINILFVGRLEKRKGLKYLLTAFGDLKWELPKTRLIVVGPGNLDDESQRIMGSRNIQDVVFVGNVPYAELPRYYKTAHIFCAPATGKESFGIVLLEAMAAGKPIVGSKIEGFSSVMTHGQEGLLVAPKNSEQLARAIATLVKDQEMRIKMGEVGKQRAYDFRWESVAGRVMEYYNSFLEVPSVAEA